MQYKYKSKFPINKDAFCSKFSYIRNMVIYKASLFERVLL